MVDMDKTSWISAGPILIHEGPSSFGEGRYVVALSQEASPTSEDQAVFQMEICAPEGQDGLADPLADIYLTRDQLVEMRNSIDSFLR